MRTSFSNISQNHYDKFDSISIDILDDYIKNVSKDLPKPIRDILYLIKKYNILNSNDLDLILKSNKPSLRVLSDKLGVNDKSEMDDLWELLKDNKSNLKLLPHFQSPAEREGLIKGRLTPDDVNIDLSTQQGRNNVTKMYMPMVYKIVNQYIGKSSFTKQELISSALEGFALAIDKWKQNPTDGKNSVAFKTYAAYSVQHQILNDINKHSHALSGGNGYNTKNGSSHLDAFSLDRMLGRDDDGDFKQDHLKALGTIDQTINKDSDKLWNEIYKILDKQFNQKTLDIFYRFFGLHGYKREKSKDIAKSLGMSEGNIRNSYINKVIKFLKTDSRTAEILSDIQTIYSESIMCELIGRSSNEILEYLINDDMFILLEDINRWSNINVFTSTLENVLKSFNKNDSDIILNILSWDFETTDRYFKQYKKLIINFLNRMYPTENMTYKTDVSLLNYIGELQNVYKKIKH